MSYPWHSQQWEGTREERAVAMFAEAVQVDQQPENTTAADHALALYRMYEQRPITALSAYAGNYYGTATQSAKVPRFEISEWNVLRAVVNTGHAMIARSRVRGRFITSKGSGIQKKRAQEGTHWMDGWSDDNDAHYTMGMQLKDAMVGVHGTVQLYTEDGMVCPQRCLPLEINFDYVGSLNGKPRVIYRKRAVSKGSLLRFAKGKPAVREAIEQAPILDLDGAGSVSDMTLVREAYCKASPGGQDGWHAMAVQGVKGCIVSEPWAKPWWPFILSTWEPGTVGMIGVSLAAQLEQMQAQLNFMMLVERKAQRKMLAPHIYLQKGSKIVKSQISNEIASIIEGTGQAPVALNWNALPQEFYNAKADLIDKMYALAGISQNASEGTKAPGTESGIAQREAMEQQNLRIQIYTQHAWERPHTEMYNRVIEMAADLAKAGHSYEIQAPTSKGLETVDIKGVLADLKKKKVTIYPTGFLPLTPAARLDFILQMINSQLWDVDRAREALSDLDVDSEQSAENAIQQMFVGKFEDMLYKGKPAHPNELDVGYYGLALKNATVFQALAERDPEISKKNLSLLRRYIIELKDAVPKPAAPPAPAMVAPPAETQQLAQEPLAAVA